MDRQTALDLDRADPLASFPAKFSVSDNEVCYLDGNSLGRFPLNTRNTFQVFGFYHKTVGWRFSSSPQSFIGITYPKCEPSTCESSGHQFQPEEYRRS
jgi:hypothetical protein